MPDNPTAPAPPGEPTFPPMYYDSPVNQMVLGVDIASDDSLTAAITVGAPYFKVSATDVCNWVADRPPVLSGEVPAKITGSPSIPARLPPTVPTRHLSAPVAVSDGVKPLVVKQGQHVRLWITADVPKGAALPPGKFTGTVVLTGKSSTKTVTLQGTYLGTLMGKVLVQPQTVVPGQPVLVQVCDASGKPLSDPAVTVTIQGVPASARYYQFPTVGSRNLVVVAAREALHETTQVTVVVAGTAMTFRSSLTAPTVKEVPMLQVAWVPGQPYAATFTLGTTASVRRVLAEAITRASAARATTPGITASVRPVLADAAAHAMPAVQAAAAPAAPAVSHAPADALGAEFAKVITALPSEKVMRLAPTSTKTAKGIATSSAVLAAVGGLQTKPAATSYRWDFGDGQTLTTQSPHVTHDYFPATQAGKVAHSFDVTCTVVHDNVTVKRTLVLHSAYGLCRRLGVIVPPVTGTAYATFQHVAFSASLIVHNLEASPITLNSMACVPLSDDATVALPAPKFTTMHVPVVVAARSASGLGVYIPLNQLQLGSAVVNGFAVYYSGEMQAGGTSVPVRFSYAFRIPLSDSGRPNTTLPSQLAPASWDLGAALQAVTGLVTQPTGAVSKAGGQIVDPATKTVAIALSTNPGNLTTLVQVRSAVQAGLTSIALKTGALTATRGSLRLPPSATPAPQSPTVHFDRKFDPLSPPPVAAGNECYPDDISDADAATASAQQLVCQLTNQTETETISSSFQNAQAGDVILSPAPVGGGDLIAAMFRALTPAQHHGHSGFMTANFFEITHCTASVDRITANVNTDAVGIPTSLNGNMLQYAWPGSITQSIDDATSNVNFKDPSGASYTMNSFNTDSQGDGFEIIPPLVVKPLPEHEAAARPPLRKAADTARSKGAQYDSGGNLVKKGGCYYSFYGYTDPQLSAGFTDAAGADALWAQGLSPAVCSSFVWLSLKEHNIPLVTSNQFEKLSDFSAIAVAGGAQVGPATLDGLIFYPQAERLQGAQALRQMFMNQALSKEDGLGTIPGVNEAIAGPIADQLLNVFASGNPNLVGSSAWQTPGVGNAVSPDNIIYWNPPYFGYAEPLQYLPRHTEQYTISKWTKVITWGSIKGKVRSSGAPVPNAHVWVYLPGGDAYTAADGSYTLNHIPIGQYKLKAQAVITTNGVSAEYTNGLDGQPITLTAANSNIVQNIELQGLPVNYRRVDMTYSMSCDHGDANPFNTHGVQTAGPFSRSLDVNPGQVTNSLTYTYDYNGGGYFHIDYTFTIALLQDLSIEVTLVGTMYDDGGGGVQDQYSIAPFNVPIGGTWSGWTNMEHSNGYHNGPAIFTFSVTNNQQTG
jgi:hypothetical protein